MALMIADYIRELDWIEDAELGVECADLGLAVEPATPAPHSATRVPPCGFRAHQHQPGNCAGWSAATWLCAIAQRERQDPHAITKELRDAPGFAHARRLAELDGDKITSSPYLLPWFATVVDGETVYKLLHRGASIAALLERTREP